MIGLSGTKFSDVEKEYKNTLEENKKIAMTSEGNSGNGGYLDKTNEKRFHVAVKVWREYIVNNKNNTENVKYLNELTIKNKGDITKGPRPFVDRMRSDFHSINRLFNELNTNKDIKDKKVVNSISHYSFLSLFVESVDFLTDPKYISAFSKAYSVFDKNKNKPVEADITNIFLMSHQIITFYICLCISILNREVDLSPTISGTYTETMYGKDVEFVQQEYKSLFSTIGYTTIQLLGFLKSIKNPSQEIDKAIRMQDESRKVLKAAESYELTDKMKVYSDLSKEAFLVDRSLEPHRGEEEAVTIALIVLASIAGFFVLINIIKRAIYLIGTIKIDIMKYIMIDEATIDMNITVLKEKLANTTDAKEQKKLKAIIEKQEKWLKKFESMTAEFKQDANNSAYQADAMNSDDETYIQQDSSDGSYSSSDNGDFTILM